MNYHHAKNHPGPFLIVLATVMISFGFGLGSTRLWDRDEPRNARATAEMLDRNDWVVPTFNGQLRTHKPVLLYWLEMLSYECFGRNSFAARFPSVIAGMIAAIAVFAIGKRYVGRRYAMWPACVLATSLMMVVAARAATPDACLIATTTVAIISLVCHAIERNSAVLRDEYNLQFNTNLNLRTRLYRDRFWYLGFAAMGLAVLAKGPVGIVMPLLVVTVWHFWQFTFVDRKGSIFDYPTLRIAIKAAQRFIGDIAPLRGLAIAFIISGPWYALVSWRTNGAWLYGFLVEHNINRATSAMEGHHGGLWYYPVAALVGLFPWSLLLLPIISWIAIQFRKSTSPIASRTNGGFFARWRSMLSTFGHRLARWTFEPSTFENLSQTPSISSERDRNSMKMLLRLGIVWLSLYVLVFSIAKTKLPSYITPGYPGAALIIGGFLWDWNERRLALTRSLLGLGGSVFGTVGLAIIFTMVFVGQKLDLPALGVQSYVSLGFIGIATILWLNRRTGYVGSGKFWDQANIPKYALCNAVLLFAVLFGITARQIDSQRDDLNVLAFPDNSHSAPPTHLVSLRAIEPSWVFYRNATVPEVSFAQSPDIAIEDAATALAIDDSGVIVSAADALIVQSLLNERFGIQTIQSLPFEVFQKREAACVLIKGITGSPVQTSVEVAGRREVDRNVR